MWTNIVTLGKVKLGLRLCLGLFAVIVVNRLLRIRVSFRVSCSFIGHSQVVHISVLFLLFSLDSDDVDKLVIKPLDLFIIYIG